MIVYISNYSLKNNYNSIYKFIFFLYLINMQKI